MEVPQGMELTGTNSPEIFDPRFMFSALKVLLYAAFLRHRLELRLGVTEGSSFWRS